MVDEIDETAAKAAHRRNVELARTHGLAERTVEQPLRPVERRRGVVDAQRDRAHGRAVRDVERMRKAFRLFVDHQIDVALLPARDALRLVLAGVAEAEARKQLLEAGSRRLVDGEFDELHSLAVRAIGKRRGAGYGDAGLPMELVEQIDQRAMPVDRDRARGARAELVVEDFQRDEAVIAGRLQGRHEVEQRQVALPRQIAEMTAPLQHVHVHPRRIRDLHQENAVARDRTDRLEIGVAGEDVEGVEHQPDRRMIGAAHDLPGVAIVVDVPAPGERLETDAHAALGGAFAKLVEIGGGPVDAAERCRATRWSKPARDCSRARPSRRTCVRPAQRHARAAVRAIPQSRGRAGT